ncbi:Rab5-interacting family protein [Prunus dulcis]|uniref:Rab5-interacting family protein n=1 Tax=Prunus dulcis TaxID=3755 RepID=A0A4Y1RLJ0_PRUDU|nr:Rab5-interacting family protein [Prunus dulcis]
MKEGKSVKLNGQLQQQQQQQHQNGHLSPFKFAKLLDPEASWDKDQLGDVLHWIRQAMALVCGLLWGAIPLVGGIWFIIFLVISTGIIYGYYAMILNVDEEDFGGHGALLQEGLFASITLFLSVFLHKHPRNVAMYGLQNR